MLGDKIYSLRKNKKISQEEFARILNTSRQAVSKWERNESKPDVDKLVTIAKIFNVSVDFLLNYEINYSDVDAFIKELEHCTSNNLLTISLDDIRLWCSKYVNNFKLHINAKQYLIIAYFKNKNVEYLNLALSCLNKAIEVYNPEDNDNISLHDLHKSVCEIYEIQQKYELIKEYIKKHNLWDCNILLVKCDFQLGNYDDALELASKIYLESSSNIINASFIQLSILLKKNKIKEVYDLVKWSIEFINSVSNSVNFFKSILYLYVYLKAVCEKILNLNCEESIKILKEEDFKKMDETTIAKSNVMRNYFGKTDELLLIDINVKDTIKESTLQISKKERYYNVLVDLYKEIFGENIYE